MFALGRRQLFVVRSSRTLNRFAAERDKQLMYAGVLRPNSQQECSVLLVDQLTQCWLQRPFTSGQQLTYKPTIAVDGIMSEQVKIGRLDTGC